MALGSPAGQDLASVLDGSRLEAATRIGGVVLTTLRVTDAWREGSMADSRLLGSDAYQIVREKTARSSLSHCETIG